MNTKRFVLANIAVFVFIFIYECCFMMYVLVISTGTRHNSGDRRLKCRLTLSGWSLDNS